MNRRGIDWHKEPDPYRVVVSPERPGIRKEDIGLDAGKNALFITAIALKHGKRDTPLKLSLDLPFVELIEQQWEVTKSGEKVWNLSREYAWEIIKELNPKLYTHYFRLNRATEFVRIPSTSPAHLLNWFGWSRLQTAYDYLALGGRNIEEMSNAMRQQYTGKVSEPLPEKEEKEEPVISPKPKVESRKEEVEPKQKGRLSDEEYERLKKELLG